MLTGSTVKEWDTMLFLKDVSSPQEYDQAIFRLQNQYIKEYVVNKKVDNKKRSNCSFFLLPVIYFFFLFSIILKRYFSKFSVGDGAGDITSIPYGSMR